MIPRLSKVFSQSQHQFRERDFTIRCDGCGKERNLSKCTTSVTPEVRTYRCPACTHLLVVVGYPTDRQVSAEGCRPGTWLSVHPTSELFVQVHKSRLGIAPARPGRIYGEPLI
jgi:hypothetical protein